MDAPLLPHALALSRLPNCAGAVHDPAAGRHLGLRSGCHQADGAVRGTQRQELFDGADEPRARKPAGSCAAKLCACLGAAARDCALVALTLCCARVRCAAVQLSQAHTQHVHILHGARGRVLQGAHAAKVAGSTPAKGRGGPAGGAGPLPEAARVGAVSGAVRHGCAACALPLRGCMAPASRALMDSRSRATRAAHARRRRTRRRLSATRWCVIP
jgi:hypothetical protein